LRITAGGLEGIRATRQLLEKFRPVSFNQTSRPLKGKIPNKPASCRLPFWLRYEKKKGKGGKGGPL